MFPAAGSTSGTTGITATHGFFGLTPLGSGERGDFRSVVNVGLRVGVEADIGVVVAVG